MIESEAPRPKSMCYVIIEKVYFSVFLLITLFYYIKIFK
jgi:hypothetical protein